MKITKHMLKRLIQEELLREDAASDAARARVLTKRAQNPEDPLHTPKELGSLSTMTADQRKQKEVELKDVQAKLKEQKGYLAKAEQYLSTLSPRAMARSYVEKKIVQLEESIYYLESQENSLVRDLDLGELEWPGNEEEADEDYMYPPRVPSSTTPGGKPYGRRYSGLEEQARITKHMLKRLVEQGLQEAGFQMAPGTDEGDPEYGEQITGQLYDYGIDQGKLKPAKKLAKSEDEMDFDEDEVVVDPTVTDLRSMADPYGRAIATVRENRLFKNVLQQMIMQEMQRM